MKRINLILFFLVLSLFFVPDSSAVLPVETGLPLWTVCKKIAEDLPQPLFQTDVVAGVITISSPGHYLIRENIEGTISIESDDVILDLDGHEIYTPASLVLEKVIGVQKGREKIIIKNGTIRHEVFSTGGNHTVGVDLQADSVAQSSCVSIENVKFFHLYHAIYIIGQSSYPVSRCSIKDCMVSDCYSGVYAAFTLNSLIAGFRFFNSPAGENIAAAVRIVYSWYIIVEDCMAFSIHNTTGTSRGFVFWRGGGNTIRRCLVEDVFTPAAYPHQAYGIQITEEDESKALDCVVSNVSSSGTSSVWGFLMGDNTNCLFQGNKAINCFIGFRSENNPLPGNNVVIQNVTYNCTTDYTTNISNVETYNPLSPVDLSNPYNNIKIRA